MAKDKPKRPGRPKDDELPVRRRDEIVHHAIDEFARAAVTRAPTSTVGPAVGMRIVYGIVRREAPMLAYVDQFRSVGLLIQLIVPLVFLLKRPVTDNSVTAEPAHGQSKFRAAPFCSKMQDRRLHARNLSVTQGDSRFKSY